MKQRVKRVLPRPLLDFIYLRRLELRTRREYNVDRQRYARYMNPEDRILGSKMTEASLETQATKDYHRVEKALALGTPKRPFGADLNRRLTAVLQQIDEQSDLANHASSALAALNDWNADGSIADEVSPRSNTSHHDLSPEEVERFFSTRHSVRNFDMSRLLSRAKIEHAIAMASRSPSVCNRQAWRVWIADDMNTTTRVLGYQNGNRGFGSVPAVAVVTADARLFAGPGERNQAWIDGGLFAMTLSWALHGLGIASCMLNMSTSNSVTDALRTEFGIPDHELVVMMIAIGYAAEPHRVARSPRRPLTEIVRYIK